jgi:ribosome maturation factor RimP
MSQITEIIQQAVTACDLSLYGIDKSHEGFIVYIEKENDAIGIAECEAVMKQINYSTDTDELHIEVSSKGPCPPLLSLSHYQNAIGKWVKIRTNEQSFKGVLTTVTTLEITLQKNDHTFTIATPSVKTARLLSMQPGE